MTSPVSSKVIDCTNCHVARKDGFGPEQRDTLRIAFVVTRADSFGGASVHVRDLAAYFRARGHEVLVFLGGTGPVTDALKIAGVPFVALKHLGRPIKLGADLRAIGELRMELRKFQPDIVSTHTSKAGFLGRIASWSLGIPAIYTPHCWSFVEGFPGAHYYLWAERFARPFGRRIIMVSEAERQEGLSRKVGSTSHLVTVHNGMPDVGSTLRADPSRSTPRLVMVGRCEAQKDHLTLFHALGRLKKIAWTLDCIGDGPLRPQLESAALDLGIRERVNFLGYRRDVAEHLSRAQVFVLITHWESFPRSIIEAMRAGLPVIATGVGGTAEAVIDGETGFVVGRGDVDDLTERLEGLIQDASLRTKFGTAGRRRYETEYTLERMVRQTAQVWEAVLDRQVRMN